MAISKQLQKTIKKIEEDTKKAEQAAKNAPKPETISTIGGAKAALDEPTAHLGHAFAALKLILNELIDRRGPNWPVS